MWRRNENRLDPRTIHWRLESDAGAPLTFRDAIARWSDDASFRAAWANALRQVPFDAYCWECPPLRSADLHRPFECVLVHSPALAGSTPDSKPFRTHFRADREAVAFESLGRDALLVAPCPVEPGEPGGDFSHLATFTATATPARIDALWRCVGEAVAKRLGADPLWLSTAGLGVAWLHARLDSRPKYYRHAPYRQPV
jgi:hypothetical protein